MCHSFYNKDKAERQQISGMVELNAKRVWREYHRKMEIFLTGPNVIIASGCTSSIIISLKMEVLE